VSEKRMKEGENKKRSNETHKFKDLTAPRDCPC
jgi:hypothetical protein